MHSILGAVVVAGPVTGGRVVLVVVVVAGGVVGTRSVAGSIGRIPVASTALGAELGAVDVVPREVVSGAGGPDTPSVKTRTAGSEEPHSKTGARQFAMNVLPTRLLPVVLKPVFGRCVSVNAMAVLPPAGRSAYAAPPEGRNTLFGSPDSSMRLDARSVLVAVFPSMVALLTSISPMLWVEAISAKRVIPAALRAIRGLSQVGGSPRQS